MTTPGPPVILPFRRPDAPGVRYWDIRIMGWEFLLVLREDGTLEAINVENGESYLAR